ncbi:hypothetical protein [Micromonospora auratinigra]|uniref:Uncharacterized protein n=1 Tax=Micromonospora auratinigra TaxID=261654 RepID=A0A1A9A480_9ACTN|nr:hypothetical protein [Micromonospora auratinigra]SBT50985.1 hypothetical protein GA0070611_4973 [Micromonospora auratinigra]
MDTLDRLAEPGLDLLGRVDTLLAGGAPEGHRLWPLLRRMQVLPGQAVREFLDLHPAPLAGAGHAVRRLVRGYDDTCAVLADEVAWSGPAAAAYDEARAALLRHLDEGPESLVGRLESTAGYADALADWVEGSRLALARALAEVLRSAEAVTVHAATRPGVEAGRSGAVAAAEIATRVLGVLGVAYDGAENLLRQWGPSLAETTWRERPAGAIHYGGTTRIGP